MGTLGQYLRSAREARGIDLRDAAQQTRISLNYLKALEDEDFSRLPGEVFVKGFLKNYCRFLSLDESEVMKSYAELKPKPPSASGAVQEPDKTSVVNEREIRRETSIEPFVWASVIFIALLVLLFTSLPVQHLKNTRQPEVPALPVPAVAPQNSTPAQAAKPEKLYLEVVALEDTWILVRTDTSPQKKAVLKKGESLIWSADERFLLSYGRGSAVKLLLNGEELTVKGNRESVVRDLVITRAGIMNQPSPARPPQTAKSQPQPQPQHRPQPAVQPQPQVMQPLSEPKPDAPSQPSAPPSPAPVQTQPLPTPVPAE